jgi:hypothetical protein
MNAGKQRTLSLAMSAMLQDQGLPVPAVKTNSSMSAMSATPPTPTI